MSIWIGADPGGQKNFGVAILAPNGVVRSWCVDHGDAAIEVVCKEANSPPSGVGVDAPLWWSSGKSGDRKADQWLRNKHDLSGGQVQASNSLRGAALIQGAMFVYRLRKKYPEVKVTETHPKALLVALDNPSWAEFCDRYAISTTISEGQTHERDAIISAVAAREAFEGRWTNDLSKDRFQSEIDPDTYWLGPVHYYWPV